ncbi:E3 ubiquitin-protein ligase PRT6-like [Camellia sinensis]|uniref:E3 ubiquitin-protein ligase PRT6-like n=1 Tax=Camellia sinensis TaxID=4442 RepID=UPI001036F180|nr:E3 ubiquitin-protein ligase PRT6-like [Camellia sinensis]
MWEEIGGQISILSPDRYGHIDWSIFEGIIVNSLEAKDAISRYVRRIVFEGGLIVDPDQGEFLCPVCRGLANSAFPALPGDSQKVSRPPMVSTVSWPDATGQLSSANRETNFHRFQEALSLLHSAADVAGRSEILKAFPMHRNGRIRPNPESMFRVLFGMYFPSKQDRISGSARVSHSVIMWDTLKYSLISGFADGLLVCCCCCRCAAAEFCWAATAAMLL